MLAQNIADNLQRGLVVGLLTGAIAERFTRTTRPEEDVAGRLDELAERLARIESNLGPDARR